MSPDSINPQQTGRHVQHTKSHTQVHTHIHTCTRIHTQVHMQAHMHIEAKPLLQVEEDIVWVECCLGRIRLG